jgi:hypothetical protein
MLRSLLQQCVIYSPLGSNILPTNLLSGTLNLCSSLNVRDAHTEQQVNWNFVYFSVYE